MIVLRPDHDYDLVVFIFDDSPQAWSRLWLSHVYLWWLSSGLITTMIESCLFLMIVLRPDHDYDWVMFIIDYCPQAWSRLWLSHVYFWWLSSGLITTMIKLCISLMIVFRPDHDYDWVLFIFDDCPQAWSRLWLSLVYLWWLSSGLITTMIESCLSLIIVLRLDHDYDWVMFIIDDCPQAPDHDYDWVLFMITALIESCYFWWLSSGLIMTMIESCLLLMIVLRPDHENDWVLFMITTLIESCLFLMIVLRPDHDYDWVMFIIDDCP
jgi:hypothetical protein